MEKTVLCKGWCTNGWKGSKAAEQASSMKTAPAVWPQMADDVEQVNAMIQDDRWITVMI